MIGTDKVNMKEYDLIYGKILNKRIEKYEKKRIM
jgi:hypothetical protein